MSHDPEGQFEFQELFESVTAQKQNFKKCIKLTNGYIPEYLLDMLKYGLTGLEAYQRILLELKKANEIFQSMTNTRSEQIREKLTQNEEYQDMLEKALAKHFESKGLQYIPYDKTNYPVLKTSPQKPPVTAQTFSNKLVPNVEVTHMNSGSKVTEHARSP